MDIVSLTALLAPYLVSMVAVVSATALVSRFVPYFRVPKGQKRTDAQKLALDAVALVVGIGVGLSGQVSPDADAVRRIGDGFIVAALAIKNRDVAVRAFRVGRKPKEDA